MKPRVQKGAYGWGVWLNGDCYIPTKDWRTALMIANMSHRHAQH